MFGVKVLIQERSTTGETVSRDRVEVVETCSLLIAVLGTLLKNGSSSQKCKFGGRGQAVQDTVATMEAGRSGVVCSPRREACDR